jgi:hypothetical protein
MEKMVDRTKKTALEMAIKWHAIYTTLQIVSIYNRYIGAPEMYQW